MASLKEACRRVRSGDRQAFGDIVRATAAKLVRLAARVTGDVGDGEDVVQEAFSKAFDALSAGQFDERSEVDTWLYRIVTNGAIDLLRRRQRRVAFDVERVTLPHGQLEARAALRVLDEWIAELAPDQRAALVLKELEGLSSADVARAMNVTEGAVEQLLVRARATLRARREHERQSG